MSSPQRARSPKCPRRRSTIRVCYAQELGRAPCDVGHELLLKVAEAGERRPPDPPHVSWMVCRGHCVNPDVALVSNHAGVSCPFRPDPFPASLPLVFLLSFLRLRLGLGRSVFVSGGCASSQFSWAVCGHDRVSRAEGSTLPLVSANIFVKTVLSGKAG